MIKQKTYFEYFDLLGQFCDQVLRSLDLLQPLRHFLQNCEITGTLLQQRFQDFEPTSTSRTWARLPEKNDLLRC